MLKLYLVRNSILMKRRIKATFLAKVYDHDKRLFLLFSIFLVLQIFFTWKGVETIPFFNYGMYSARLFPQAEYHATVIRWNDSIEDIALLSGLPVNYLFSILQRYSMLKQHNFSDPLDETVRERFNWVDNKTSGKIMGRLENTPADEASFNNWLCSYLQKFSADKISTVLVTDRRFKWENNKYVRITDQPIDTIFCHP